MKKHRFSVIPAMFAILVLGSSVAWAQTQRWSEQKANDWYAQQPWLVGQQLHSEVSDQPVGDVAGSDLIPSRLTGNWGGQKASA